jgi:HEPN domain-containing protein
VTKERHFKRPYAKELIAIAENDFKAAQTLAKNQDIRKETIFFTLQQVVEKSLKALLVSKSQPVPLVHDIALIFDRLRDEPELYVEDLNFLTDFASIRRYEEGIFVITDKDLDRFFKIVFTCYKQCKDRIEINIASGSSEN